jgi:eukaryotic-like serine/threonine-protein kinase
MSQPSLEINSLSQSGMEPGTILGGKYRVDGFLGAGGMGVVLSATNIDLDAPVAIKVVRDEFADNEEVVSRMVFEARSVARLRSAHVVRVLDVARLASGAPYIVMECLQGGDLATLLSERGALPIAEAVAYVLQACEGLAEAHALGIVHRDLKPENLFLAATPEGSTLKILDFGISKDTARRGPRPSLTSAGRTVGSPFYMSPEQMRASPNVDRRADIWSLGAVLFELVTGKCPFQGQSMPVVCSKVLSQDPPPLRSLCEHAPDELDLIIRRCLEKNPDARYDNVTALAAALRDFASSHAQATARRARLAASISSINLRRERAQTPPPSIPELTRGLSPTLPSIISTAPVSMDPALAVIDEPARKRRWIAIAAVALATIVASGGAALWQRGAALSAASRSIAQTHVARVPPVSAPSVNAGMPLPLVVRASPPPSEPVQAAAITESTELPTLATVEARTTASATAIRRASPSDAKPAPARFVPAHAKPKPSVPDDPGSQYDLQWSNSSGHYTPADD